MIFLKKKNVYIKQKVVKTKPWEIPTFSDPSQEDYPGKQIQKNQSLRYKENQDNILSLIGEKKEFQEEGSG